MPVPHSEQGLWLKGPRPRSLGGPGPGPKAKMKSHSMPEAVAYWRWVSPHTIALVTASAVYHWSVDGQSEPRKVFDRKEELAARGPAGGPGGGG